MNPVPLTYHGEGEFRAPKAFAKRLDAELVIGETLKWEVIHERSGASHRHFFALVNEAFENLPETIAAELPNPDALRKHCLIKAGFCDVAKIVCANDLEAILASNTLAKMDGYRICTASGNVVTVYTARSQSVKAMGKAEFQKSKDAVLSEIGKLIGADPAELGKAA